MQSPPSSLSVFPFVGDDRKKIVKGLANVYQQVQATGKVHWVSLEAESGWGKTRIVHQFYEHLASLQSSRYWPPEISYGHDLASSKNIETRRKLTHPDYGSIDREAGSLPEFMWLGIDCAFRNGLSQDELLADIRQLEMHKIYLARAWGDAHSMGAQVQHKFKKLVDTLLDEGVAEGLQQAGNLSYDAAYDLIEQGAHAVPGLGIVVRFLRDGVKKVHTMQVNQRIIDEAGMDEQFDAENALIEQITQTIQSLSCREIPFVIVIEDLHRANERLKKLLEALVQSSAHILIISTSWCSPELDAFFSGQAITRFNHLLRIGRDYTVPPFFDPTLKVTTFKHDQVKHVVAHFYPDTTATELTEISSHFTNPFALELFFGLKKNKRKLGGALELGEDLGKLKTVSVERMYQAQWSELEENEQFTLCLAASSVPENALGWHSQLVANTVLQMVDDGMLVTDEIVDVSAIGYDWSLPLSNWMQGVAEQGRLEFVRSIIEKGLIVDEVEIDEFLVCFKSKLDEVLSENSCSASNDEMCFLSLEMMHLHRLGKLTGQEFLIHAISSFEYEGGDLDNYQLLVEIAKYVVELVLENDAKAENAFFFVQVAIFLTTAGKAETAISMLKELSELSSVKMDIAKRVQVKRTLYQKEFLLGDIALIDLINRLQGLLIETEWCFEDKVLRASLWYVGLDLAKALCDAQEFSRADGLLDFLNQEAAIIFEREGASQALLGIYNCRIKVAYAATLQNVKMKGLADRFNQSVSSRVLAAENHGKRYIEALIENYFESHITVLDAKADLANFLMSTQEYARALPIAEELIKGFKKSPSHKRRWLRNRAEIFANCGKFQDAQNDFYEYFLTEQEQDKVDEFFARYVLINYLEEHNAQMLDNYFSANTARFLPRLSTLANVGVFLAAEIKFLRFAVSSDLELFENHLRQLVHYIKGTDHREFLVNAFHSVLINPQQGTKEWEESAIFELGVAFESVAEYECAAAQYHYLQEHYSLSDKKRIEVYLRLAFNLLEIEDWRLAGEFLTAVQLHVSEDRPSYHTVSVELTALVDKFEKRMAEETEK